MKVNIIGMCASMLVLSLMAMDSAELEKDHGIALQTVEANHYLITYNQKYPVSFVFVPGNEKSVLVTTRDLYILGVHIDAAYDELQPFKLKQLQIPSDDTTKEYCDVRDVVVHPSTDGLGIGLDDGRLIFWGTRDDVCEKEEDKDKAKILEETLSTLEILTFACNGKVLLGAYNQGMKYNAIRMWDIHKHIADTHLYELGIHNTIISSLASAHYALLAASGSLDQKIKVWDLKENKEKFSLEYSYCPVDLSFSHDSKYIVVASATQIVGVIDLLLKDFLYELKIKEGSVNKVLCHPSKNIVAVGCDNAGIKIIDIERGTELLFLPFFSSSAKRFEVNKMQFSRLGTSLGALVNNKQLHVWYKVMQQKKNMKKEEIEK